MISVPAFCLEADTVEPLQTFTVVGSEGAHCYAIWGDTMRG